MPGLLLAAIVAASGSLTGLDTLSRADVDLASRGEPAVRTEIVRIATCLRDAPAAAPCIDDTDCALPSPSACANVSAAAWRAYLRHYLALLVRDATVGPAARASQKSWEAYAAADCAVDGAVWEVRKVPYGGYYAELCTAGLVQARALALRGYVVNLYAAADQQGGVRYPGKSPFPSGKHR